MTGAEPSIIHQKDKEVALIGKFLRLSVDNPKATEKARIDLYKSIVKSDCILQALVKLMKTHGSERGAEKCCIVGVLTDAQTQLHRANHLASLGIQRVSMWAKNPVLNAVVRPRKAKLHPRRPRPTKTSFSPSETLGLA
ncbi:hypothetical protein PHYPSEUDO_010786 [Phytophthora pseudosyringae]|uniref:Uncharacterized protein n=1 Tax=Phytophthora pseudosyringae TaxID=221518 RepID=A0A8T1W919_9STRA|nr:hypothetical protein PHYPSEUDO_010786 [Phytophthora pseudosyringae]